MTAQTEFGEWLLKWASEIELVPDEDTGRGHRERPPTFNDLQMMPVLAKLTAQLFQQTVMKHSGEVSALPSTQVHRCLVDRWESCNAITAARELQEKYGP